MFNRLGFFIVSVFVLFSNAIYANEDTDILPVKGQIKDSALCSLAAKQAGMEYGVNYDLLQTIAAVESGRWDHLQNRYVAWPWTVNVKGKGYYYDSKEEALAAIKKFQEQGIRSIDVGCMQVNMKFHGAEFASMEEALDPVNNVKYSAKFLRTLYSKNGNDWKKAAEKYHSANPSAGAVYSKRLETRFETYKVAGLSQDKKLF
ncbi:MAG: transglycosylase SLT domain-containing protein [Alphaproteobacteria bacterium]|nr:transglycosylase SLT domain-containing protein [Alphaproteobacteria bacterium]MBP5353178.1 transglycosylase SLT domain-containing protein [Alphaproteobacteria bacterium]